MLFFFILCLIIIIHVLIKVALVYYLMINFCLESKGTESNYFFLKLLRFLYILSSQLILTLTISFFWKFLFSML